MANQTEIWSENLLADLFILAGNVALENSGFRTFGFGAGREDVWEPDLDVNWGDEKAWLTHRHPEALAKAPLGATEMGLIYVNPKARTTAANRFRGSSYPRDLRQHGHERRRNRGADCGWSYAG